MSDLMEEHIDSGSRCNWGHPLMLVAEGYAYCHGPLTSVHRRYYRLQAAMEEPND